MSGDVVELQKVRAGIALHPLSDARGSFVRGLDEKLARLRQVPNGPDPALNGERLELIYRWRRGIGKRLGFSWRRFAIFTALYSGRLPWQDDDWWLAGETRALPLCSGGFTLCCGHTVGRREAQAWVDHGLVAPVIIRGGVHDGNAGLVLALAGRIWAEEVWQR